MKHLLILFCLCCTLPLCAQETTFGLGMTYNYGSLYTLNQEQLKSPNPMLFIQTTHSGSLGINGFVDFATKHAFKCKLNIHLNQKKIGITATDLASQFLSETMIYRFNTIDLGVSTSYKLFSHNATWKVYPKLGFSIGINQFSNSEYSHTVSGNFSGYSEPLLIFRLPESDYFYRTFIQLGIEIQPPLQIGKFPISLCTDFNYGTQFFTPETINIDHLSLEGQYYFLSIGLQLFLFQKKGYLVETASN